jgi:hypothetical protein
MLPLSMYREGSPGTIRLPGRNLHHLARRGAATGKTSTPNYPSSAAALHRRHARRLGDEAEMCPGIFGGGTAVPIHVT